MDNAKLREEMNVWVVQLRRACEDMRDSQLKIIDEVDNLKQEINALKLIQIITLKNRALDEKKEVV